MADDKTIKTVLSIEARLRNAEGLKSIDKSFNSVAKAVSELKRLGDMNKLTTSLQASAKAAASLATSLTTVSRVMSGQGSGFGGGGGGGTGGMTAIGGGWAGGPYGGSHTNNGAATQLAWLGPHWRARAQYGPARPPPGLPWGKMAGAAALYAGYRGARIASGVGASLFNGVQGAQSALSGIPVIGGVMSGMLGQGMSAADESLRYKMQFQQQMLAYSQPGARIRKATEGEDNLALDAARVARIKAKAAGMKERGFSAANIDIGTKHPYFFPLGSNEGDVAAIKSEMAAAERKKYKDSLVQFKQERRINRYRDRMSKNASRYGYGIDEATGIGAEYMQAAGGGPFTDSAFDGQQLAVAASRLGIGAQAVGQLGFGARRGTIPGKGGFSVPDNSHLSDRTNQALRLLMANTIRTTLQGPDRTRFMEQVTAEVGQTRMTGAGFQLSRAGSITEEMARMGAAPEIGSGIEFGLRAAGRQIGQSGPEGLDWLFLRHLGGLQSKGPITPEALQAAKIKMERGDFGGDETRSLMKHLVQQGGGGAGGEMLMQAVLGQKGLTLSSGLAQKLGRSAMSGKDSTAFKHDLESAQRQADQFVADPQGVFGAAAAVMGPQVQRRGQQRTDKINAGDPLIDSSQDFSQMSLNALGTVSAFSGALEKLTTKLLDWSTAVNAALSRLPNSSPQTN